MFICAYWSIPLLTFVISTHPFDTKTLIGFHLSLPLGYVELAQLFCTTTETITYTTNSYWNATSAAPPHSLNSVANTRPYPTEDAAAGWTKHSLNHDLAVF